MTGAGLAAVAVVLVTLAYLAAWPVPAEPVAWVPPPSSGFAGDFAPNHELTAAELLDAGGEGPEDVAVAPDGTLYTGLLDGRIMRLAPDGSPMPAPDSPWTTRSPTSSFVPVVETACYRVRRLWLRGPRQGASEVLLDGLPAFPDGITGDGAGTFWLALVSPRNRLLDALHPFPVFKKALLRMPAALRPGPKRYGFVLAIDGDGRVIRNLQDPAGGTAAFVTNAVPHAEWLYLGMLHGRALARLRLAGGGF